MGSWKGPLLYKFSLFSVSKEMAFCLNAACPFHGPSLHCVFQDKLVGRQARRKPCEKESLSGDNDKYWP